MTDTSLFAFFQKVVLFVAYIFLFRIAYHLVIWLIGKLKWLWQRIRPVNKAEL